MSKKAANRQNEDSKKLRSGILLSEITVTNMLLITPKKLAVQDILTYCANRTTTVPMYADAFGLLVFAAPLTSINLSKNKFLDRLIASVLFSNGGYISCIKKTTGGAGGSKKL